ncbi:hypothetical protein DC522_11780 [Microvirga sp. KLBC 81]|uniref:tyrosine-type recombinase/integrase n=1 Tax=Microvirga sp. KLBC 81 TaxID=1862707 RepID=UPI000D51B45E|nr:hypothetical protein DC522_11780 [Microvirga sp. KLBC 81]
MPSRGDSTVSHSPSPRTTNAAGRGDNRLKVVKPASVRRELVVLHHVFEVARAEWNGTIHSNPVHQIKLPSDPKPRERRLEDGDDARLLEALRSNSAWYLRPLIALAIETGMRRGELPSIRWKDVDMTAPTICMLRTKNGHPRTIPLTPKAVEILASKGG